ncbi:MAG: sigma-70 family RNA polymerase sigma factor, partial [Bacteroidetes bacterium]
MTSSTASPSDETLVARARQGDEQAFRNLVERYESTVAATVIGMLGAGPEAEDVGQETFIRFYRALHQFRGEAAVGTYLTRIAINLSLNALKRRRRRRLY